MDSGIAAFDMEEPRAHPPETGAITKLAVQKNNPDRVSVFIDGAFAFGVHQNLVLKYELHEGRVLTLEEQQAIQEEDRVSKAKARALDYLAHKPRTVAEVRRKLREKEYEAPVIDAVVEQFRDRGYLDDEQYAEDYVRSRFSAKGYGPVRLEQELRKRGLDRHLAETAVEDFFADADVLAAAREHAEKGWTRIEREDDPRKRRDKLYRYLTRRGYTYDTVRQVIEEMEARRG